MAAPAYEPRTTRVVVCALTYHRPDGLERLLRGLNQLTFQGAVPAVSIVIVDNDPAGGAHATCARIAPALRWPLQCVTEPRRGIAFARNAALDHIGDAEWVCFVDDDEVPDPCWLDALLRTQREYDADVVAGPVLPAYARTPACWMTQGRFFEYYRYPTGHRLPHAYTNNVLFRARLVHELRLRFDERFALVGCEDRHFFQRIRMAGRILVWSDEAVVHDTIPESRMTVRWVLQRAFRYGCATSLIELDLNPGLRMRTWLLACGGYRILKGALLLPLTWWRGWHRPVTCLRHICYGAGLLAGWCGLRYQEYRRTHGS